jgi:hypothetical protein
MNTAREPINALTVDVEDYFQVEAFANVVRREDWTQWEPRVERNTARLLELATKLLVTAININTSARRIKTSFVPTCAAPKHCSKISAGAK